MIGMVIILYFVVGLCFAYIAARGLGGGLKTKDPILFFKVEVVLLLFWPLCLLFYFLK